MESDNGEIENYYTQMLYVWHVRNEFIVSTSI